MRVPAATCLHGTKLLRGKATRRFLGCSGCPELLSARTLSDVVARPAARLLSLAFVNGLLYYFRLAGRIAKTPGTSRSALMPSVLLPVSTWIVQLVQMLIDLLNDLGG